MANKLLICGTAHEHTMETYHFLTKGFRFRKSIYFAFLPSLKDSLRQKIRSNLDSNYKGRVLAGPGKIQAEEPEESLNKSA
jgi:hypothetical protein